MNPGIWEPYITGGEDGDDAQAHPTITLDGNINNEGTLMDYLGYETTATSQLEKKRKDEAIKTSELEKRIKNNGKDKKVQVIQTVKEEKKGE